MSCLVKIFAVLEAISVVWFAVSVSNEVNSVITFVEPTIKFSAVKSPATNTSPVISKALSVNTASSAKAKVLFTIFVILSPPTKAV